MSGTSQIVAIKEVEDGALLFTVKEKGCTRGLVWLVTRAEIKGVPQEARRRK
jgi:hypothetical protein